MTTPDAQLNFPPEWMKDREWLPGHPEIVEVLQHRDMPGEKFFIAGGVIEGGSNLIGLAWSTGQHVARCAPPLWAIEERVDPNAPAPTRAVWRGIVASLIRGYRAAEAEMGRPPR